jgi:hypothetical protein
MQNRSLKSDLKTEGLYYKTLRIRNLRDNELNDFVESYHLLAWSNILAWTNKNTSLLRSLYITKP